VQRGQAMAVRIGIPQPAKERDLPKRLCRTLAAKARVAIDEERQIIQTTTREAAGEPHPVLKGSDVLAIQSIVRRVPVSDHVVNDAINIVRATRPGSAEAPSFIKDSSETMAVVGK